MADKYDESHESVRWFISVDWHLMVGSTVEEHRGQFFNHGAVSEINSVAAGKVGEQKNVALYKFVLVEVKAGAIMEISRVILRVKKCYTKAVGCNKQVIGCIAKGKPLRETGGSLFLHIVIV